MDVLPSADEKARMMLDVYQHFGARPDEELRSDTFMGIAADRGWRASDIADGLERACELGWIEQKPDDAFRLTASGFAAI